MFIKVARDNPDENCKDFSSKEAYIYCLLKTTE